MTDAERNLLLLVATNLASKMQGDAQILQTTRKPLVGGHAAAELRAKLSLHLVDTARDINATAAQVQREHAADEARAAEIQQLLTRGEQAGAADYEAGRRFNPDVFTDGPGSDAYWLGVGYAREWGKLKDAAAKRAAP